jgi:hypothetical protein
MFTCQITVVLAVALAASGVAAQGTGQVSQSPHSLEPCGHPRLIAMQATWYNPGLGACGISNSDSDLIVAVSATTFDQFPGATGNPNNNPICNRGIQISCECLLPSHP